MSLAPAVVICAFLAITLTAEAQTATVSVANTATLPLRNVSVEVRQVRRSTTGGQQMDITGTQATHGNSDSQVTAQVMVLNGRPARLATSDQTPLRLFQAVWVNGQWRLAPGTVWSEAGKEIWVTPRWEGTDDMFLDLSTRQSTASTAKGVSQVSSAASTVIVPLDTWTTIATSDLESNQSQGSITGNARQENTLRTELMVRARVR